MKGEVEVTFKCEGCGSLLLVSKHHTPDSGFGAFMGRQIDTSDLRCPKCADPTYGPLTVEIVAEALQEADEYADDISPVKDDNLYAADARLVIRLLNARDLERALKLAPNAGDNDWPHEEWRKWLLDLARQP
jgi:hypothetical protein